VYGPDSKNIPQVSNPLRDQNRFSLLGVDFSVLSVPGHTLDHIALFCMQINDAPVLFSGDTLFAGGCGRVFEGNPAMMLESLTKLAQLPPTTQVYCAHEYTLANLAFAAAVEPKNKQLLRRIEQDRQRRESGLPTIPSSLASEIQTNPFLRCAQSTVVDSALRHSGKTSIETAEVFAIIRDWKNHF
jgi:hydroxyacylglutathione hydrolase